MLVGHRHKDRSASYVDIDNERAAEQVTDHLIGLGRRRVGHITGRRGGVSAEERLTGYRRAMERARLPADGLVAEGDYLAALRRGGAPPPSSTRAWTPSSAPATPWPWRAIGELRRRGVRVPEDVAVAGFDDLPEAADADPPLTTHAPGRRASWERRPPTRSSGCSTDTDLPPQRVDPAHRAGHPPVDRRLPSRAVGRRDVTQEP